jgi:hypothetical protein
MNNFGVFAVFTIASVLLLVGCKDSSTDVNPAPSKAEIIVNDIPYQTDEYLRIPYTIKLWRYPKEGLVLNRIEVLNDVSKSVLQIIEKADLPHMYIPPLKTSTVIPLDTLDNVILSLQLPIPLSQTAPARVSHRFTFKDTLQNKDVVVEGAVFTPRTGEVPLVISSPVKGTGWQFDCQSSNGYHFYTALFSVGKMYRSERFAFDAVQWDATCTLFSNGPLDQNSSYFCYRDTLYAVAGGTVIQMRDGMEENAGNIMTVPMPNFTDLAGNYLIINIGGGNYACYAHIVPGSFMVQLGSTVKSGQPVALLGNAGNSDGPHLHFQIVDAPDFFWSCGVPFVIDKYKKIGELYKPGTAPGTFTNRMMEARDILEFN